MPTANDWTETGMWNPQDDPVTMGTSIYGCLSRRLVNG